MAKGKKRASPDPELDNALRWLESTRDAGRTERDRVMARLAWYERSAGVEHCPDVKNWLAWWADRHSRPIERRWVTLLIADGQ